MKRKRFRTLTSKCQPEKFSPKPFVQESKGASRTKARGQCWVLPPRDHQL
ncbi:unnamed protein product [Gulo gulo]|uniref:Uncharacterized protein n=1 Tax=Gulo gulo TaxID=48420 RepID=A0A9X9M0T5_GULGU|nr:unnamed protein product [Gulo gulo]